MSIFFIFCESDCSHLILALTSFTVKPTFIRTPTFLTLSSFVRYSLENGKHNKMTTQS